jgi:hypothetical protein
VKRHPWLSRSERRERNQLADFTAVDSDNDWADMAIIEASGCIAGSGPCRVSRGRRWNPGPIIRVARYEWGVFIRGVCDPELSNVNKEARAKKLSTLARRAAAGLPLFVEDDERTRR